MVALKRLLNVIKYKKKSIIQLFFLKPGIKNDCERSYKYVTVSLTIKITKEAREMSSEICSGTIIKEDVTYQ